MDSKKVKIGLGVIFILLLGVTVATVLCVYSRVDKKVVKDNDVYRVTLKYRSFFKKYYHNVSLHDLLDKEERKNVDPYSKWVLATNLDDPNNNDVKMVNATEKVPLGNGGRNWDLKVGYLNARSFSNMVNAKALFTNLASKTKLDDWADENKIFTGQSGGSGTGSPGSRSLLFAISNFSSEALVTKPVTDDSTSF